jgi:hypothetical protein
MIMPKTKRSRSPFPASFRLIAGPDLKRVEEQLSERLKVVKLQRTGIRKATAAAKKWLAKQDKRSEKMKHSETPADRDMNSRRLATVAQLEWLRTVGGVAWQPGDDEPLIESLHQMGFTGVAHAMQRIVDRRIDPANPADEEAVLLELQGLIQAVQQDLKTGLPHQEIPGFGNPPDRKRLGRNRMCVDIDTQIVAIDGVEHQVTSLLAVRWLNALWQRANEWVSSAELSEIDPRLNGALPHRLKKFFPKPILTLIESKRGTGSRLLLS